MKERKLKREKKRRWRRGEVGWRKMEIRGQVFFSLRLCCGWLVAGSAVTMALSSWGLWLTAERRRCRWCNGVGFKTWSGASCLLIGSYWWYNSYWTTHILLLLHLLPLFLFLVFPHLFSFFLPCKLVPLSYFPSFLPSFSCAGYCLPVACCTCVTNFIDLCRSNRSEVIDSIDQPVDCVRCRVSVKSETINATFPPSWAAVSNFLLTVIRNDCTNKVSLA